MQVRTLKLFWQKVGGILLGLGKIGTKHFFQTKKLEIHKVFAPPPIKFSKKIKVLLRFHVVIFLKFLQ